MRVLVRRMKIATTINVFFLYPQNDFLLGNGMVWVQSSKYGGGV